MERWRQWTAPVDIVDDPAEVIVEDGVMSRSFNVKWPAEVVEKIAHGYQCLRCMEPQPSPFPVKCGNPFCEYPMRAHQARDFELEFNGSEQFVGDAQRDWEELERLAEASERKRHKPGSSISVPSGRTTAGGVVLPKGVDAS